MEIEVGFKIKEDKIDAEKILLKNGFVNTFKTAHTRDIYFGKDVNFDNMSEEEIKNSLVRCRGCSLFENLEILDPTLPKGKVSVNFKTAFSYFDRMFKEGYDVVFDTEKTDWIYKKGKCYHQLQEIKDIGLIDYVYNEEIFGLGLNENQQFEILKKQMIDLGFHLEYELGVDKLRSLYSKELKFSKNQIGKYNYQK